VSDITTPVPYGVGDIVLQGPKSSSSAISQPRSLLRYCPLTFPEGGTPMAKKKSKKKKDKKGKKK
jgi:hypothetical protein